MIKTHLTLQRVILFFLIVFSREFNLSAQSGARWNTNPFENKEFIENKGQFISKDISGTEEIKYAINQNGVKVFFTCKGWEMRYDKMVGKKEEGRREEKEEEFTVAPQYLVMNWDHANPTPKIIAEDPLSYHRTFGVPKGKSKPSTIKANLFKKITYKDLYPGIDVEFYFPENKPGFKYNVILHPGADASQLKMAYTGVEKFSLSPEGNMILSTSFGDVTDHAPNAFNSNENIPTSFVLKGNTVSFEFPNRQFIDSTTENLIIDPWVTSPTFITNKAYDVSYDQYGNVYAYGSFQPFEYVKMDKSGAIQWKYSAVYSTFSQVYYGDFAVDYKSSSSYLFCGADLTTGSQIIQLDPGGVIQNFFPGNTNLMEMWRSAYNSCTHSFLIAGGGPLYAYQAAIVDTTLTALTPVNILNATKPYHDIGMITIDNSGNCFMLATRTQGDPYADNVIIKTSASTLGTATYMVPSYHTFIELKSINYYNVLAGVDANGNPFTVQNSNGFNGIAVNASDLFTYDGAQLKKWDKSTGTLIKEITAGPNLFAYGGLEVSACDTIYVGVLNTIKKFDINLNYISSISLPDTVYDLKLGQKGIIYASGKGFVTAVSVSENCGSLNGQLTANGSCSGANSGSAAVNVTGGSGNYTYSWNNGGTTSSVSNLASGIYTVAVTDHNPNFCSQSGNPVATFTVNVSAGNSNLDYTVNASPASCDGTSGSASVAIINGNSPYSYSWSIPGQTKDTIRNIAMGTYFVTVSDASGCQVSKSVTITGNIVFMSINANDVNACINTNASIAASTNGGGAPYTYVWNPGSLPGNPVTVKATVPVTYTVTATDKNNCTSTKTMSLSIRPQPTTNAGRDTLICTGKSVQLSGSGAASYSWSPTSGLNNSKIANPIAAPKVTTTYILTGKTNKSCALNDTVVVVVDTVPGNVSGNVSICAGHPVNLNATGGGTYRWSPGSGLNDSTIANPMANPASTTNYSVTIMDGNGCFKTANVSVAVTPSPKADFDLNPVTGNIPLTVTFTNLSVGADTYFWSFGQGTTSTLNNPAPVTYSDTGKYVVRLIVANSLGCTDTIEKTVYTFNRSSIIVPNVFTPDDDGINDNFKIKSEGLKTLIIDIYDRWGLKITTITEVNGIWDGKTKSGNAPEGTYYYILNAAGFDTKEYKLAGFITLLRH